MEMALLNRFFPSKKKNHKQGYVPFGRNEYSCWKPSNFTREQVRLLLFRECDARGRKLLFDSNAVQRTVLENQQCSKLKLGSRTKCDNSKKTETYVEVTNGVGYQYTRPNSDVTLMGEMIFGSVAMTFKGMTCKVHSMKSPDRFMCSRVFHAPTVHVNSKRRSDQSIDSSGSSVSSVNDSSLSLSGNYETRLTMSGSSGPLDVPQSEVCGKAPISSLEGDSGFCGDASLRSISSVGSGYWSSCAYVYDSQSASHSTLGNSSNSGGSLASLQRRWMRNISTSLELGVTCSPWRFIRGKSSSGLGDEVSSRSHRKTQLGLTIVISVPPDEEKDMEIFFFEHMAIIEGIFERLQNNVEKAYMKKDMFVHLMMDAFYDLQQWLCDLFTAPRITSPVWISLSSSEYYRGSSRFHYTVMSTFLRDFCQLIAAIDTKATNFFISTLLTAVLTHHLGWVATIMPAKAPPSSVTKPPCTLQMLHALAKSHPYNALWAQLGDLHGALGNPVKIARTIVTANAKKNDLLNKLLTSLSYFIRCGNIEKRIDSQIVVDSESNMLDSVMENLSSASLNSSTASTSTIVPDNSVRFEREGSDVLIGECRIISGSKKSLNECSEQNENKGSLQNQSENSDTSLRPSSDAHCVVGFKKSSTFVNSLNVLSEIKNSNSTEDLKPKLYPDISNVDNTYLHPDVISEKVSRLCRIPTNALLYHMKSDEPGQDTVNNFLPKKVDCEKQLSSVQCENRGKYVLPLNSSENFPKECDNNASKEDGVIFVLGDNEKLVDLKSQNGCNIPKSKSDNILCSETLNIKVNGFQKTSCYPSLEGLSYSPNSSCFLEVNANSVQKNMISHKNECSERNENLEVTSVWNKSSNESYFSNYEETNLDSGIVFEEETPKIKVPSVNHENVCDKVSLWKNERTKKSVYDNQTLSVMNSSFLQDINGNPRTSDNEVSHSCKIVTSHSFIIELEDVNSGADVKISDGDRKLVKHVARSQSLSFPDRKSIPFKKPVRICRRHSENMHVNERYLRDYHSVRFNFERCDGVLSDYVEGIGVDKSPESEKKSIKISEARGNFELQEKTCENCEHRKQKISVNSVLCSGDVCDCVNNISFSKEYGCDRKDVLHPREGNALFDEYGTLSDDELLSSTEIPVESKLPSIRKENINQPSFIELPLPWYSCNQHEQGCGLAASLLGGVSDHYMPDMILHACTQSLPQWEATLKRDLTVSAHRPMLDQEVSEAVCIVGNADLWEVQLVSSHVSIVDKPGGLGIRVGMSQLVANMLESLLHLWKLRTPPEQCLQHLESKLRELCLRSQALAELLLTTELCDMATLTSSLGLEANDVPLLMAIASTHSPQVTNLYGLSFR